MGAMYDVIVVGGGPAGSAAAKMAGASGLEVLLLDKEEFPRNKLCGGALSRRVLSCLGSDIPDPLGGKDIFGMRVRYADRSIEHNKGCRLATMVTRYRFDDWLLAQARETGAIIRTGERVIDCREAVDHVEVITAGATYRARFVIIAEGAQGRLKHRVRRRDRKWEYGISMVAAVAADNGEIDARLPGLMELHPGVVHMGYGWVFPHDGYYSVGVWGPVAYVSEPRRVMGDFLRDNGFTGDYDLRGHVAAMGGIRRSVVTSRMVLAGDAAGFVDPFSGEGIAFAIRSGQIAAEVIADMVLRQCHAGHMRAYERRCHREFGRDFRYALLASRIMNRFPRIFFSILTRSSEALDRFLEVPNLKRQYLSYLGWVIPRVPRLIIR